MIIIDEKFRKNKLRYFGQCTLATLTILAVLIFLDIVLDAAVIASLGASCFIVFLMPHVNSSRPRFLVGGYLVGITSAYLCFSLSKVPFLMGIGLTDRHWTIILGSLAVGLSMFIMVITDTEHPPAAGMSLGLVIDGFNHKAVVVVLAGVILLSLIRWALKKYIINLL